MPKIRIFISKEGNPCIMNVEGAGQNCVEATKNFEKMLGQAAEDQRQLTPSFYEEELPPQELTQEDHG